MCVCSVVSSCLTVYNPMDCSPPGALSVRFPRQEYWSGLPFPPPGNLPNPGIKPASPASPALCVPLSHSGKSHTHTHKHTYSYHCCVLSYKRMLIFLETTLHLLQVDKLNPSIDKGKVPEL